MRYINEIIIHCSATKEGLNFNANDIDRWHKQRGFKRIGYHYVILLNGTVQQGRELESIGAHCTGHNAHSIGVCYIGGLDKNGKAKDTRTRQQKAAMWELMNKLCERFPDALIYGHNEFASKSCPSFDVQKEYGDYNEMVKTAYYNDGEGED